MASLPADTTAKVSSVVLFGDPMNGTAVVGVDVNRVLVVCHKGDFICKGGDVITKKHLTYAKDAGMAAMFALVSHSVVCGHENVLMRYAERRCDVGYFEREFECCNAGHARSEHAGSDHATKHPESEYLISNLDILNLTPLHGSGFEPTHFHAFVLNLM